MLTVILALIILYIILGIIGFVVHGLLWLFVIAAAAFVLTMLFGGSRLRRRK